VEEVRRVRPAREEMPPADGARPEAEEGGRYADHEPSPVRVGEPRGEGTRVDFPEQPHEERDTDRDPQEELDQPSSWGHATLESERGEDGVEDRGHAWPDAHACRLSPSRPRITRAPRRSWWCGPPPPRSCRCR